MIFGYIKESKLKEQELLFEARIQSHTEAWRKSCDTLKEDYQRLLEKYEDNLKTYEISLANEVLLNEQNRYLSSELYKAKSISFPTKRFNIKKSVELLTTELTDKTLAKLLHDLSMELASKKPSHLESLEKYVIKAKEQLNNYQEDEKTI